MTRARTGANKDLGYIGIKFGSIAGGLCRGGGGGGGVII